MEVLRVKDWLKKLEREKLIKNIIKASGEISKKNGPKAKWIIIGPGLDIEID